MREIQGRGDTERVGASGFPRIAGENEWMGKCEVFVWEIEKARETGFGGERRFEGERPDGRKTRLFGGNDWYVVGR